MRILDVGCGRSKVKGADGLDVVPGPGVDIVHDLNVVPYPIPDDTYDRIYAIHVIEHVEDFVSFMRELHRVSRNGAEIVIMGPHCSCPRTIWIDPTHRRGLSVGTFRDYFSANSATNYYIGISFEVRKTHLCWMLRPKFLALQTMNMLVNFLANISQKTQYLWERVFAGWVGGFEGVEIYLTVRK